MSTEERVCKTCGVSKPLNAENFNRKAYGGFKGVFKGYVDECKACHKIKVSEAMKARWAERKELEGWAVPLPDVSASDSKKQ